MSSKLTVYYETQEKYNDPKCYPKQRIEVPVRYVEDVKLSRCRTRTITRSVTAKGTVEIERYGRHRAEYGTANCKRWIIFVVRDGNSWIAVDRKESCS
jgi:hypothetical protein